GKKMAPLALFEALSAIAVSSTRPSWTRRFGWEAPRVPEDDCEAIVKLYRYLAPRHQENPSARVAEFTSESSCDAEEQCNRKRHRPSDRRNVAKNAGPGPALAGQPHAVLRDPGVDAPCNRTHPGKRQSRREPPEAANTMEELGHGVGAGERTAVGQHELHGRHARFVGEMGKPAAPRRRAGRKDLEPAAGHRQTHEPERAGPAHRAVAVVDQDGRSVLVARLDRRSAPTAHATHYDPQRLSVR